ncbi:MAG TPA: aldolase/citrate lyase family protein [Casimicrobiaceae bacterium]|nr:aldolase/citrate lyase family protein [Casimicrobiaceae bacterium]
MRPNRSKALALADQPALGTMCNAASPLIAEWLGHSGYDFICVDLQHGENDLGSVGVMLQALSSTPATPVVRVAANVPSNLQRVLDLGAYGVIVPLVNTAADAEAVVQSVRYAPRGARSWGPVRGAIYGGPDYFENAATTLLTLVMIESAQGLDNAREILSVDGIDGCFVGPADLNITLGHSPNDPELGASTESGVGEIARIARDLGKIAGVHAFSVEDAKRRIAQGFRFMTVMADTRLIRAGATVALSTLRQ